MFVRVNVLNNAENTIKEKIHSEVYENWGMKKRKINGLSITGKTRPSYVLLFQLFFL